MITHVIETTDDEQSITIHEFADAIVICDKDEEVSWILKEDLPKLIGKLAEIAGNRISRK